MHLHTSDEVENSVRRLLLLKIVLYSMLTDGIDGLRPDSVVRGHFLIDIQLWHLHKKGHFSLWTGELLHGYEYLDIYRPCMSRYLCCNGRVIKNRGIVRQTDIISENWRSKCPFIISLQTVFA